MVLTGLYLGFQSDLAADSSPRLHNVSQVSAEQPAASAEGSRTWPGLESRAEAAVTGRYLSHNRK